MFQTIIHPTDFDNPSTEAFRVARSLAQMIHAKLVVFHVLSPPAVLTQDGKVIRDPKRAEPEDLWTDYRKLASDTPAVAVHYAVVVGEISASRQLLEDKIRELGPETLVVMGTHAHQGVIHLLLGSKAEEAVRECPCAVLVVKATSKLQAPHEQVKPAASQTGAASENSQFTSMRQRAFP
jgi:nucleotide-binding universal stress UspA family protein